MKNKSIIILIVVIVVVGLYLLGNHLLKPKYGDNPNNPYDLKLDSIGLIDKEKYCSCSSYKISLDLINTKAIAIDSNDRIFVSGESKIQILDSKGKLLNEFNTNETATALTITSKNELIAGLKDHIEIFDLSGKPISKWSPLKGNAYITSTVKINDIVYVADAESETVTAYNNDGELIDIYGDSVPPNSNLRFVLPSYYFDIAKDPEGFLWIANTGKHKLINLKTNGDLRSYWGNSSSEVEGFCGCCNPSHFTILEDGSFITSEKGIVRIKKYNAAGQFDCAIAGPETFKKGSEGLDIAVDSKQNIYILEPKAKMIHIFKVQ